MQPQMTGYPTQQPNQQQQPTLQSQMTGYPGTGTQQQFQPQTQSTAFQNQQQQPQPTGFQVQQPQQQPQPTGFQTQQQVPQSTGFPSQPQQATGLNAQPPPPAAAPRQRPQPTGMTSSQMANSFKTGQNEAPLPPPPSSSSTRIPKQRLSFITADDQAKFEQLFKSAVGTSQALSGDQARDLLMRSKLPGNILSDIW